MTPVVFLHGLWLPAGSWQPWAGRFAARGYAPVMPGWPGEPGTVEAARRDPGAIAGLGLADLTAHHQALINTLPEAPVLVGHSCGGLIAQQLLGLGLGRAAVAIGPAPILGVQGRPPAGPHDPVSLTAAQFRSGIGNAIGPAESDELFHRWAVPAPGGLVFETVAVDVANTTRGPLLLISGQEDRTAPDAMTRAAYKLYGDSSATTELKQYPGRGHSLTIDSGWRQVAGHVLGWLARNDC